jgi:serine/threonine-protein phosphatase PGAM5
MPCLIMLQYFSLTSIILHTYMTLLLFTIFNHFMSLLSMSIIITSDPAYALYYPIHSTDPMWDPDWDARQLPSLGDTQLDRDRQSHIRSKGVTRHIILVRHGQYHETHKEDHKRILTPLGRQQAHLTGARIASMIQGAMKNDNNGESDANNNNDNDNAALFTPCKVVAIRVSDMARAKETAQIISSHLPVDIVKSPPDALLNEGRPAHNIPGGQARPSVVQKLDECHPRTEAAFETYFYRAPPPSPYNNNTFANDADTNSNPQEDASASSSTLTTSPQTSDETITATIDPPQEQQEESLHEFEIIVGHANAIRYFFCRALQLPPEAWLRLCIFNCSLTYLTIRPTGTVSCRMLGDIGHLPYDHSSFSMHHGFNW